MITEQQILDKLLLMYKRREIDANIVNRFESTGYLPADLARQMTKEAYPQLRYDTLFREKRKPSIPCPSGYNEAQWLQAVDEVDNI